MEDKEQPENYLIINSTSRSDSISSPSPVNGLNSSSNSSISGSNGNRSSSNKKLTNKPANSLGNLMNKRNSIDSSMASTKDKNRFIKIWIQTVLGVTYEVCILPDEPIFNLKLKLEIEEDIPVLYQTLYYGDDELNDSFTIEEYAIEHGATLKLVLDQTNKANDNYIKNQFTTSPVQPTFTIDEKTYNSLYETDAQSQIKHHSLTDSKSIDEFRLVNTNSNLGCISVNENKIDGTEERQTGNQRNLDQLMGKMERWSIKKPKFKLPNLSILNDEEQLSDELRSQQRKLSDQRERNDAHKKCFKFFPRFRSNSSFNLVVDCVDEKAKSEKDKSQCTRPSSVPVRDTKLKTKKSSVVKSNDSNSQSTDQHGSKKQIKNEIKSDAKGKTKNQISSELKDENNNQISREIVNKASGDTGDHDTFPLPRIKLPPVEIANRKKEKLKEQKCTKCKIKLFGKNECKCEQDAEQPNDKLIGKLNKVKSKKKLPKI